MAEHNLLLRIGEKGSKAASSAIGSVAQSLNAMAQLARMANQAISESFREAEKAYEKQTGKISGTKLAWDELSKTINEKYLNATAMAILNSNAVNSALVGITESLDEMAPSTSATKDTVEWLVRGILQIAYVAGQTIADIISGIGKLSGFILHMAQNVTDVISAPFRMIANLREKVLALLPSNSELANTIRGIVQMVDDGADEIATLPGRLSLQVVSATEDAAGAVRKASEIAYAGLDGLNNRTKALHDTVAKTTEKYIKMAEAITRAEYSLFIGRRGSEIAPVKGEAEAKDSGTRAIGEALTFGGSANAVMGPGKGGDEEMKGAASSDSIISMLMPDISGLASAGITALMDVLRDPKAMLDSLKAFKDLFVGAIKTLTQPGVLADIVVQLVDVIGVMLQELIPHIPRIMLEIVKAIFAAIKEAISNLWDSFIGLFHNGGAIRAHNGMLASNERSIVVERGEAVIPNHPRRYQGMSTDGRGNIMGGSGGGNVTINISAMDGPSIAEWLRRGGYAEIINAVKRGTTDGYGRTLPHALGVR